MMLINMYTQCLVHVHTVHDKHVYCNWLNLSLQNAYRAAAST